MDSLGLGKSVCQQLISHHQMCIQVEVGKNFSEISPKHYVLNPGDKLHYQRLLTELASQRILVENILHLFNYEEYKGEISQKDILEPAQQQGLYSLLFLVQA
jgi:hypothetical protein